MISESKTQTKKQPKRLLFLPQRINIVVEKKIHTEHTEERREFAGARFYVLVVEFFQKSKPRKQRPSCCGVGRVISGSKTQTKKQPKRLLFLPQRINIVVEKKNSCRAHGVNREFVGSRLCVFVRYIISSAAKQYNNPLYISRAI